MKPVFFKTTFDLRKWFEKNHKNKDELLVGFYKVGSGKKSITWSESVDEALCFGWIDGVRKSYDEMSYTIRFTPRKPGSIWSAINIKKIEKLKKKGLMHPLGLSIFEKRSEAKSKIYAHENETQKFSAAFEKLLKSNKKALKYFEALAPGYRKLSIHWVMNAKQVTTQIKRMNKLIKDCENGMNQWKDNKYKK